MQHGISRRQLIALIAGLTGGQMLESRPAFSRSSTMPLKSSQHAIEMIESATGCRLGVAVRDVFGNILISYRGAERFPFCSTIKTLIVATVLAKIDQGLLSLSDPIRFSTADLLDYAPITRQNVENGSMKLGELCAAAIEVSDNSAANLLLRVVQGTEGVNEFVRSLNDFTTRLDRCEPDLNEAIPGDERDTTTPEAITADLHTVLIGGPLSPSSRRRLIGWMTGSTTGKARLRAGLPANWEVADKTGSGEYGTSNVVALVRRPDRVPLLIGVYMTNCQASPAKRDASIASIGNLISQTFSE